MQKERRALETTAMLTIVSWGIVASKPLFVPVAMAGLIALTLAPIVKFLTRVKVPEGLAVFLVFIGILTPLGFFSSLIIYQGRLFIRDFPQIIDRVQNVLRTFMDSSWGQFAGITNDAQLIEALRQLEGPATQGIQLIFSGLGALLAGGSDGLVILVFALVMLILRDQLYSVSHTLCLRYFGNKEIKILDDVTELLGRFIRARLLIVLIVGVLDTFILEAFRIKYSLILGSFLGFMTLFPVIGLLVSLVPPIALAVFGGLSGFSILLLMVFLLIVSAIEGYLLTPKLVGSQLNINLLATFVGIYIGNLTWGIWGMLLSIPLLGVLRLVLATNSETKPWADFLAETPTKRGRRT